MRVSATTDAPVETAADTIVVGVFAGKGIPHDVDDGALQALVDSGEAKARFRALAVAHAAGKRWILVGLGPRDEFDAERARVAAAVVHGRAKELSARTLCWELPHKVADDVPGALVEGTVMAAYRFAAFKADDEAPAALEELIVSAHHDVGDAVARAATIAAAVNRARDLQNTPANHMTPSALAHRALELAEQHERLTVEVEGRDGILERGMGAFAAVAQGSYEEPALITLRLGDGGAPPLGLVGKAVTFDTGGLSLKPPKSMEGMKFDMSGGAAVIEAIGAIAELGIPIDVAGVVGATENMPSGRSIKPGDVVTAMTGTTIQVDNTDAEGRLVLADCLARAVELGCERIVDVATLTGAIEVALGTTYAGLVSTDDELAAAIEACGRATGDLVWRLPMHPEYGEMIKAQYADLANTTPQRKAGSITAAHFLSHFVGDTPWAHLDIAGTADDAGRPYAPKGGTGFGVRLLVELARSLSSAP